MFLIRSFFFESAHICKYLQQSCRSAPIRKDRKPGDSALCTLGTDVKDHSYRQGAQFTFLALLERFALPTYDRPVYQTVSSLASKIYELSSVLLNVVKICNVDHRHDKISMKNSKCAISNEHIQNGRPSRYQKNVKE